MQRGEEQKKESFRPHFLVSHFVSRKIFKSYKSAVYYVFACFIALLSKVIYSISIDPNSYQKYRQKLYFMLFFFVVYTNKYH